MNSCIACGMPLENPNDIGATLNDGSVCVHCSTIDGKVKSCEEVFEGGVQFFLEAIPSSDRVLAEKLVRKNMKALPYWQKNGTNCLDGEEANEQEFNAAMAQLA